MKNKSCLSAVLDVKGFTLIELLVVVLIIGILASVAVPQYKIAVEKSRYTQLKTLAMALANAQEFHFLASGEYSHSFEELSIETPDYVEETADIKDGVNRPHRFFSWGGDCTLWDQGVVSCYRKGIAFFKYPGQQPLCIASNTDLSSWQNKLCKRETGLNNPDSTYGSDNYWTYP